MVLNNSTPKKNGVQYLITGFKLSMRPELRRFVLFPLLINIFLFSLLLYAAILQLGHAIDWILLQLPSWLHWLNWLLWPLAVLATLFMLSLIFTSVMNFIAAPFNGLLAEKVELLLTGKPLDQAGNRGLMKETVNAFAREWCKLKYYLPRVLLLFILSWVPLLGQTVIPAALFAFVAWMMAIGYCDLPFDNHRRSFADMRQNLSQNKLCSLSFGAATLLSSMIPLVNFIVMPAAVCGATAMYVDKYRLEQPQT